MEDLISGGCCCDVEILLGLFKEQKMTKDKRYILKEDIIAKKLKRLALEIVENNLQEKELIFVGIQTTGVIVAKWLQLLIAKQSEMKVELLTMKMDKHLPKDITLSKDLNFDDKVIIIIDDVTNSGRTLLYAMKPFLLYHPKKVQTLVLVERSHSQYPVSANYKGISLATTLQERIIVEVKDERIVGAYLS